ncbi:MAG TPA: SUMF1/EgtB/PvdO family nonheme iron enzyme [Myxococcota bacterium]|jgi:hypothetical protein
MIRLLVVAWLLSSVTAGRALAEDPCAGGPAGMKCVPAGAVTVGDGELKRDVTLERFFIDDHVVTSDEYKACVDTKACLSPLKKSKKDAPVLVDWPRAERYCAFAGKRLPSESEWQAAASKGALGEGDNEKTAPQWTKTWSVTPKTCPSASAPIPDESKNDYFPPALCGARDVLDACDGAVLCGTLHRRVWKDQATPSARKDASSIDDAAAEGFRCATSTTYLTKWPSQWNVARPALPDPAPPTAEELAIFNGVEEDTLEVPPCPKAGRSFLTCRDPASYLKSNEPKLGVLEPYVTNMGGAYTGVASDQNYTFIALAHSRWAWAFDYDANVVRWHHVLRAIIIDSADRKDFLAHFAPKKIAHGVAVLDAMYKDDAELKNLETLWKTSAPSLADHYKWQSGQSYTWLGSDEHFAYIKLMYTQGRLKALRGNMLDVHAMHSIGEAAKKLNTPIHIYYPSNAAEFWPFNDHYRDNVRNFPFDDESIVVQTISGLSLKTGFGQTGYWQYNVQYGHEQQALLALPGYTREKQLLWHRIKTDSTEVTLCGLPTQ